MGYLEIESIELWGVRETLAMAERKGWEKVRIFTDAKNSIKMIKKGNNKNGLLTSIRKLFEQAKRRGWKEMWSG